MRLRRFVVFAAILWFTVSPVVATTPVPRKSPDLVIAAPTGKPIRLSSLSGKVVVLEFLVTNCPHCFRVANTISKLQWEMGSRGLQSVGVAFDKNVDAQTVTRFTGKIAVTYPIGYVNADKVDSYLGRTGDERFRLPQIVVIDRKGVIRAQSQPEGEKNLEDENYLRNLLNTLLKEQR